MKSTSHLRTRLFKALVVSILLYNSEIWVPTLRAGAMDTHDLPQVPAKDGQIPQSALRWQGTSLRCRSVEKDEDAECLLSHRPTP